MERQIKALIQELLRIGLLRPTECHCCSTETVLTNTGFYPLQVTWGLRGGEAQVMGCMLSHFSRVQLFATPWTVAFQGPLSMRILLARILEWVAIPSSKGSSWPRDQTHISCLLYWQVGSLLAGTTWEAPRKWGVTANESVNMGLRETG